jgi:hypothetical protein
VCYRVLIVRRAIAPLMSNITLLHQNATHYDSTLVNIPRVLDQRVIMGTPSFASLHQPPSSIVALVFMPRGGGRYKAFLKHLYLVRGDPDPAI